MAVFLAYHFAETTFRSWAIISVKTCTNHCILDANQRLHRCIMVNRRLFFLLLQNAYPAQVGSNEYAILGNQDHPADDDAASICIFQRHSFRDDVGQSFGAKALHLYPRSEMAA